MILRTTAFPGTDPKGTQNLAPAQYLRTLRQVGCSLCYSKALGLLQGLPAMAPRSPQALSLVRRYQVRPAVRILVPQDEWNIAIISAQRQGSRKGKNTTTLGFDLKASTAPTRLSHRNTTFAGEPCGNDGIDAHVEKRWRTSAGLHRPYEAQIGSPPFPPNRFENSFVRNPWRRLGKFRRRSFQQSLGKPCSVYVNANRPKAPWEYLTFFSFTTGFPHYHKACYCCFFILGKGEEAYEENS